MPSVILELLTGAAIIGSLIKYVTQKRENDQPEIFGRFCICYTKGDKAKDFTYIPWISRTYKTENDLNYEEEELGRLAHDPKANSYFRDQGFDGFAIIDLADGREWYWARLQNENFA